MLLILAIIYFIFNRRIPQTSSGIMHSDPWILVESDSSDDEEITSISKDVEKQILMVNRLNTSYFTSLRLLDIIFFLFIGMALLLVIKY
jgi:hypothetical protein